MTKNVKGEENESDMEFFSVPDTWYEVVKFNHRRWLNFFGVRYFYENGR
jgi:hypothetical protein